MLMSVMGRSSESLKVQYTSFCMHRTNIPLEICSDSGAEITLAITLKQQWSSACETLEILLR